MPTLGQPWAKMITDRQKRVLEPGGAIVGGTTYTAKTVRQSQQARRLKAEGHTLQKIGDQLGCSKERARQLLALAERITSGS
jgi:hypothetical protein